MKTIQARRNFRLMILIMLEKGDFTLAEIRHILKGLSQDWINGFWGSEEDAIRQFGYSYMLWRGLGGALKQYIELEQAQ